MRIIYEEEVRERLNIAEAVVAIERALDARASKAFHSPARHYSENEIGSLAFTIGGDAEEGSFGFRVYPVYRTAGGNSQFTAVYDAAKGNLKGLVFGNFLGSARTGAIGGVAIKRMTASSASKMGLIGTGHQGETQLLAANAVRPLAEVKVFSRTAKDREAFCEKLQNKVSATLIPVSTAEEALDGIDFAVTASSSATPICEANAFSSVQHVNAVGPKFENGCELPSELFDQIDDYVTDSPAQLSEYEIPKELRQAKSFGTCRDLCHLPNEEAVRNSRSMFLSVGLAGTEPVVADLLLKDEL